MNAELIDRLLAELEDSFAVQGYLGLYEFMWTARGLPSADLEPIVRAAYDEFIRRHDVRLVWSRWPIEPTTAWPAGARTPLDFDMDADDSVETPILVLLPSLIG